MIFLIRFFFFFNRHKDTWKTSISFWLFVYLLQQTFDWQRTLVVRWFFRPVAELLWGACCWVSGGDLLLSCRWEPVAKLLVGDLLLRYCGGPVAELPWGTWCWVALCRPISELPWGTCCWVAVILRISFASAHSSHSLDPWYCNCTAI